MRTLYIYLFYSSIKPNNLYTVNKKIKNNLAMNEKKEKKSYFLVL